VFDLLHKPTHLITDAYNALETHAVKRQDREKQLCDNVLNTLRNGGKVLLPCDAAGRSLELACILDEFWKANRLRAYNLVFLGEVPNPSEQNPDNHLDHDLHPIPDPDLNPIHLSFSLNNPSPDIDPSPICEVTRSTLEYARSLLEYCSEAANKAFVAKGQNLFDFAHVRAVTKIRELGNLVGPICVIATSADLESGSARELFCEWANDARNHVIFTDRGSEGSLQHRLLNEKPSNVELKLWKELLLEGGELAAYHQAREKEAAEAEAARVAMIAAMEVDMEASEQKLDEMDMDEVEASLQDKTGWSWENQQHLMYTFSEPKLAWSDYGVQVDHEAFKVAEDAFGARPARETSMAEEEAMMMSSEDQGPPSKWVCQDRKVVIEAKIKYIDLEGRADGTSVKMIIKALEPRRVILVHGSAQATSVLEQFCSKLEFRPVVRSPKVSERVDLTSDLNMYKVQLSNALTSQVTWSKCGDYEVSFISGQMIAQNDGDISGDEMDIEGLDGIIEKLDWSLGPAETSVARPLLHVGQLSLSDFKQQLTKAGVHAEFRGTGKLAAGTDGIIHIRQSGRKEKSGKISLNGKLSEDFFAVRDQLYKQYTIL